ncbi:hypothetical protein D0B32_16285 [Paraburkholderia sp. DHOC27]|nr:hypothetical protein D0B32_16285 [Paraburkholderia sp. DHOC27]
MPRAWRGKHLLAGGLSPLSLLTFFAAAKKVSAAPHRGNTNKPIRNQGKAKDNAKKGQKTTTKNKNSERRRQKTTLT